LEPAEGQTVASEAPLYRVLRSDEDPSAGISAKDPNATQSISNQVRLGSRPWFKSQFISTTTDLGVAMKWAQSDDLSIAQIDPTLISGNLIDISNPEALAKQGITWENNRFAYAFAYGSREVLVQGYIPPEAITWVHPASFLAPLL
jgi:hypothetical protein